MTQDILFFYACFLRHNLQEGSFGVPAAVQRKQILLHIVFVAIVYFPVHVDGKIGNHHKIPVHTYQFFLNLPVFPDNHTSCHG